MPGAEQRNDEKEKTCDCGDGCAASQVFRKGRGRAAGQNSFVSVSNLDDLALPDRGFDLVPLLKGVSQEGKGIEPCGNGQILSAQYQTDMASPEGLDHLRLDDR